MSNTQISLMLQLIAMVAEKCSSAEDAKQLAQLVRELSKTVFDA